MVWEKSNNGSNPELYYRTYDAVTRTLSPAVEQLTFDVAFSGNASVAAGRDGEVHVAWVDTRTGGNQILWKHYTPGVGWSADEQVVFSGGSASGPSLVADYQGHLHLVWVDNRSGNNDIFYKEFVP